MGNVETIEAGRRYRVSPETPTIADVFEFAEALIDKYGLNRVPDGSRDAQGRVVTGATPPASNERNGWTLHDAIGEFGTRLSPSRSKSAPLEGSVAGLRSEANERLTNLVRQEGDYADDKAWENAPGRTQQEVIDLLRRAREEALSGATS